MRMPNSEDMSEEQMKVYVMAPMTGAILVTGPPGTGKTVIAFQRAKSAFDMQQKVKVVMYNNVLKFFTRNVAEDNFKTSTLHSWVWGWWKYVCYKPQLPMESDDRWQHDWNKMFGILNKKQEDGRLQLNRLNWGHLIIDEGQDFPDKMYFFLENVRKIFFQTTKEDKKPAITVFADENQRLGKSNSTIDQIRSALRISPDDTKRNYTLTKNYRNTKQIADLAAFFYAGLPTGIPKLPEKNGEIPRLVIGKSLDSSIDYILRHIKNRDNEEIGIIVQSDPLRQKIYETLQTELSKYQQIKLQTYSFKQKQELEFDQPGTVTILNKQSCKGLEFDSVFLPELQQITITPSELVKFNMEMYVMIARARKSICLMVNNSGSGTPELIKHLPANSKNLLEIQHV
tara:strand:- start:464 stop:1660 length:1197 start_codon:yes stop_codon:yes gene_type:complete